MANVRDFQVVGNNPNALFTLKLHRGEGMTLIAMDWINGNPPNDFVGFSIEFKEPDKNVFYVIENRITFEGNETSLNRFSSLQSPIQKFRWVHFPRNAEKSGEFTYRVKPVFMNKDEKLSYGEAQEAKIELRRETYPDVLNVTFTRGFIASQAFVNRYGVDSIDTLLPKKSKDGPSFQPTHAKSQEALSWMGFEARNAIIELLDQAIALNAEVRVVAYDLSEAEIIRKFQAIGNNLKIIIDNSDDHEELGSGENQAEDLLKISAGVANVKRQHMGNLQHNKMIVVNSPALKAVVFGSTNFSWRGFFVQANNALIVKGDRPVAVGLQAFEDYWNNETPKDFSKTPSALWNDLQLDNIDVHVAFSPHNKDNALLSLVADDIDKNVKSSLFYSLAFLYQTSGAGDLMKALDKVTNDDNIFVYGMSDKKVGGITIKKPDGTASPVFPSKLSGETLPEPFKSETKGGSGIQLHHKFIVIDFDKPTARVYLGSYNFSNPADTKNGENLLLIKDRRIATSYMIEAVRLFDHYHFRVNQLALNGATAKKKIFLKKPPKQNENAWWEDDFTSGTVKFRDRKLFA
jgi:phosphatidylserine/phosphatidylglycerophosphate/cardiolipin synthase-like enzyme